MTGIFQKDSLQLPLIYRGQVVYNLDPNKLGRIKVKVFGIFSNEIPIGNLPWAVPAFPVYTGSGNGFGYFAVPEVGTNVFVFFEAGDFYQPVYFASAPDAVHGLPSERTTNYPYRKVAKTKSGIVIFVDDQAKVVRLTHPTGKYIQMDGLGNINIVGAQITITGDRVDINP
jgi:hypothetical protein